MLAAGHRRIPYLVGVLYNIRAVEQWIERTKTLVNPVEAFRAISLHRVGECVVAGYAEVILQDE
jgi:hypothetical protein